MGNARFLGLLTKTLGSIEAGGVVFEKRAAEAAGCVLSACGPTALRLFLSTHLPQKLTTVASLTQARMLAHMTVTAIIYSNFPAHPSGHETLQQLWTQTMNLVETSQLKAHPSGTFGLRFIEAAISIPALVRCVPDPRRLARVLVESGNADVLCSDVSCCGNRDLVILSVFPSLTVKEGPGVEQQPGADTH